MKTQLCWWLAVAALPAMAGDCARMMKFEMPGVALEITKAELIAASAMPAHCRVEGVIDRRTGVGGATFGISFALALPEPWNGRFLFQGGGGLNGMVSPPVGAVASGDKPALARGFAVVSNDTGHKGGGFDSAFMQDQQAALDFYFAANIRVAGVAKALVASYYAKPAEHSYWAGCSTGGREGMIMSQRFPGTFDGIIAGAPAMRTGYSNMALAFIGSVLAKAPALNDADRKLVMDSLMAACDAKDGVKDGMIFDARACQFDPDSLVKEGLDPAKAAALKTAFAGPKDALGNSVYPGFPFDGGINEPGGRGALPGLLLGARSPVAEGRGGRDFNLEAALARFRADTSSQLGDSTFPNLSTFSARGGKLIFFHGLSDPWFSANDTREYYEKMTRASGAGFSRLFLVPGMGHCGGGSATLDQFDLLTAITDWVEQGKAPEAVTATGKAFPGRSRPLCAYPKHAQYLGQGDPNDAKNFDCRE